MKGQSDKNSEMKFRQGGSSQESYLSKRNPEDEGEEEMLKSNGKKNTKIFQS